MKKILQKVTLALALATAGFVASSQVAQAHEKVEDGVYFIKRSEFSGRTGNITILKSNGRYAIVDAGDTDIAVNKDFVRQQLREVVGMQPGTVIDFAIVTHLDQDHYNLFTKQNLLGFYAGKGRGTNGGDWRHEIHDGWLTEDYTIRTLYLQDKPHPDHARLMRDFQAQGGSVVSYRQDQPTPDFQWEDFNISFHNNHAYSQREKSINSKIGENENFNTVSVLIERQGRKVLIGGDLTFLDEADMLNSGEINKIGTVDVFALNHHGTIETAIDKQGGKYIEDYNTNSPAYVSALSPTALVLSAGEEYLNIHYRNKGISNIWEQRKKDWANIVGGRENIYYDGHGTVIVDMTTPGELEVLQGFRLANISAAPTRQVKNRTVETAPVGSIVPVYRVAQPQRKGPNRYVLTSTPNEVKLLESRGWKNEGIAFYTVIGRKEERTKVYRLQHPKTGHYFMTASAREVERLKQYGWHNQGFAFNYHSTAPVYRMHKKGSWSYIYTSKKQEVAMLEERGWTNEGVAFSNVPKQ